MVRKISYETLRTHDTLRKVSYEIMRKASDEVLRNISYEILRKVSYEILRKGSSIRENFHAQSASRNSKVESTRFLQSHSIVPSTAMSTTSLLNLTGETIGEIASHFDSAPQCMSLAFVNRAVYKDRSVRFAAVKKLEGIFGTLWAAKTLGKVRRFLVPVWRAPSDSRGL